MIIRSHPNLKVRESHTKNSERFFSGNFPNQKSIGLDFQVVFIIRIHDIISIFFYSIFFTFHLVNDE